jgi:ATP-dependent DNA ligase
MTWRDVARMRLFNCNSHNWSARLPATLEVASALQARSCLIDGDAVCYDDNGLLFAHPTPVGSRGDR